ncbi:hypothetical protein C7967_11529 [Thalassospira sp. 11-3]|nr:hypothetical protein C7967_11529 [Thalassospira sp. 11-3]
MKKKGKKLIFISKISNDGLALSLVTKDHAKEIKNDIFKLTPLSLSEQTFIAKDFHSFVVKIKPSKDKKKPKRPKFPNYERREISMFLFFPIKVKGKWHWFKDAILKQRRLGVGGLLTKWETYKIIDLIE